MNPTESTRMHLHRNEHRRFVRIRGARLATLDGVLWITVERDPRDIFVRPGESFVVPSDHPVFVGPLAGTVTLELKRRGARATRIATVAGAVMAKLSSLTGFGRPLGDGQA